MEHKSIGADSMTHTLTTWQLRTIVITIAAVIIMTAVGIYSAIDHLRHGEQLSIDNAYNSFKQLQREELENVATSLENREKKLEEKKLENKKLENMEKRLQNMEEQLEIIGKQLENIGKQLENIGKQLEKKK